VAEKAGDVVGTAFCCPQGAYASTRLIIVTKQGQGLGRKLMVLVLTEAGGSLPLLVATLEGASLYERLGLLLMNVSSSIKWHLPH
jgi:hypothetical protein